jgi:hypothetical protein
LRWKLVTVTEGELEANCWNRLDKAAREASAEYRNWQSFQSLADYIVKEVHHQNPESNLVKLIMISLKESFQERKNKDWNQIWKSLYESISILTGFVKLFTSESSGSEVSTLIMDIGYQLIYQKENSETSKTYTLLCFVFFRFVRIWCDFSKISIDSIKRIWKDSLVYDPFGSPVSLRSLLVDTSFPASLRGLQIKTVIHIETLLFGSEAPKEWLNSLHSALTLDEKLLDFGQLDDASFENSVKDYIAAILSALQHIDKVKESFEPQEADAARHFSVMNVARLLFKKSQDQMAEDNFWVPSDRTKRVLAKCNVITMFLKIRSTVIGTTLTESQRAELKEVEEIANSTVCCHNRKGLIRTTQVAEREFIKTLLITVLKERDPKRKETSKVVEHMVRFVELFFISYPNDTDLSEHELNGLIDLVSRVLEIIEESSTDNDPKTVQDLCFHFRLMHLLTMLVSQDIRGKMNDESKEILDKAMAALIEAFDKGFLMSIFKKISENRDEKPIEFMRVLSNFLHVILRVDAKKGIRFQDKEVSRVACTYAQLFYHLTQSLTERNCLTMKATVDIVNLRPLMACFVDAADLVVKPEFDESTNNPIKFSDLLRTCRVIYENYEKTELLLKEKIRVILKNLQDNPKLTPGKGQYDDDLKKWHTKMVGSQKDNGKKQNYK